MIRINLLERPKPVKKTVSLAQQVPLLCSLILVATLIGIGWRFWSVRQQSERLDRDIVQAQQQTERLRSVLQEVEQFERQRAQLQQRVALIEELRKGQSGPVHLLDELSQAVPDRLWLTEMKQDGADLKVDGRTTSLTALSDFVGNLESSGYFTRPVEIVSSQVETTQQSGDLVKFTVKAQFVMPGMPAPVPAVAGTPGRPAARPPAGR
jgi:type IV pilus assembly protein PilN